VSSLSPLVRSYEASAVVIAGGSSGIGYASARKFLQLGVRKIALLSKDAERGGNARDTLLGLEADALIVHVPFDAIDPESVEAAVAKSRSALGAVDVLVCSVSAPAYRPELLHRTPIDHVPDMLIAQAIPPMLLTRAALPHMYEQNGGSIINVASDAAKAATPGETVLGAAMAAIVMFTQSVALEAKRKGVRANAVTPSLVSGTPTTERISADGFSKKLFEKAAGLAMLGIATPEDQAEVIAFLGGPGAARLTGQAISANGGISAH
jgi:2-hydroxycyclohexanecarboxyl-CoA dehydrogenase